MSRQSLEERVAALEREVAALKADAADGSRHNSTVERACDLSGPEVIDEVERAAILRRVTERMTANPIPPGSPRFTRDELHDRR